MTKLAGITFQSRDEQQAENYRKMMVAMASDIRVILIKLADRLHNMRTLSALPKQKQIEKAKETLDIFAPLAHRLGIHSIKWELEDLAFSSLHPRKYAEIKSLVAQQRTEREGYVERAGRYLKQELGAVGIEAEVSGRAKHFYSIYSKMTKKGREFNEIYDLTAMRVIVDSVKDCYGAIGIIHSLWKPLPGRFKDYVAMPRFNLYQALHTTVIGPEGRPLEIQIRTRHMHYTAEFGVAAHWIYKAAAARPQPVAARAPAPRRAPRRSGRRQADGAEPAWLRHLLDWQRSSRTRASSWRRSRSTCSRTRCSCSRRKGEVKSLAAGVDAARLRLRGPHRRRPPLRRREGQRQDHAAALPAPVGRHRRDPHRPSRTAGPSRDWLSLVKTTRARNKIRAWFTRERREDAEHRGREVLQETLRKQGLPAQKITGSPLLADVIREMGFRKADDFYVALGQVKISPRVVANKLLQRLKQGEAVADERPAEGLAGGKESAARPLGTASGYGIQVEGIDDVMVRLAKCCRPVPGDEIVGYISLGRGITIHREDCKNVEALMKDPERFTKVAWEGDNDTVVPGRAAGRRLGPHPPARGPLADVRRGRHQHHRGALHRQPPDGQEPLRGRGGGHDHAQELRRAAQERRLGLRRLPGHAGA